MSWDVAGPNAFAVFALLFVWEDELQVSKFHPFVLLGLSFPWRICTELWMPKAASDPPFVEKLRRARTPSVWHNWYEVSCFVGTLLGDSKIWMNLLVVVLFYLAVFYRVSVYLGLNTFNDDGPLSWLRNSRFPRIIPPSPWKCVGSFLNIVWLIIWYNWCPRILKNGHGRRWRYETL